MEIQSLKFLVTDADLAVLLTRLPPEADKVENLLGRLTPEGVVLQGEYPTGFGFKVPFETRWQVTAEGPVLVVQLIEIKVAGLPAGMLRGALARMIRDAVEGHPGVSMQDEAVRIDVAEAACAHGIDLRVNFTAVRFDAGTLTVEVG